jgi:organic hydroperoxide reductase OsmC/OhrA
LLKHSHQTSLCWTGNKGQGTKDYRAYDRAYEIEVVGKPIIFGSSEPAFRGDRAKYNPEELLVASLSGCHLLWYLHLCSEAKIVVVDYKDKAIGKMCEMQDGSGKFTEVILQPEVTITKKSNIEQAKQLHDEAHKFCFIANSVKFPVLCQPSIIQEV